MGRSNKGFAFFNLDTSFFADNKIKSLRRHYGPVGLSAYIYLLSFIFGHEEGYYMKFSSIEALSWDIAEAISRERPGKVARCVAECINYLTSIDLIDKAYFERGIITSFSIQGLYIAMCKACRRPIKLTKYRLIDDEDYLVMRKNDHFEEENGKNTQFSEDLRKVSEERRKEKADKRKVETSISLVSNKKPEDNYGVSFTPYTPKPPFPPNTEEYGLKAFLEEHKHIQVDGINGMIGSMDFGKVKEAIADSNYLQQVTSLQWICRNYNKIVSGYYKNLLRAKKAVEQDWLKALQEI